MGRSRSYNVEDRDRDQHLHEPREMVGVIVGAEERGGQVEPAVNLALARSELENGKQSDSGGKNQDQQPEGAVDLAAGVREKLHGEEEEHQVRRQQHQGVRASYVVICPWSSVLGPLLLGEGREVGRGYYSPLPWWERGRG